MIFTVLTGFAVGASFSALQPFMKDTLARIGLEFDERTETLATFAISLALLALVLGLLGVRSYPVLLLVASAIGVAYKPILERFQRGK